MPGAGSRHGDGPAGGGAVAVDVRRGGQVVFRRRRRSRRRRRLRRRRRGAPEFEFESALEYPLEAGIIAVNLAAIVSSLWFADWLRPT
jgi:hypothetical protein